MSKGCGFLLTEKYEGKNLYCGKSKWFGNKRIVKNCEKCKSYHKGYADGFAKKIKKTNTCRVITCGKAATHVICIGEYLINVCRSHARCKDARPIKKEDC